MSRKTQLDKATEQVEEAEDSGWMPSLIHAIDHEAVLKALKQAKRDKDRLAHFCSPSYNLSVFGESVSEWRKAVDWSMKAMRQSK